MQLLEYNPMGNNVEGICMFIYNTTQSGWTYKITWILYTTASSPPWLWPQTNGGINEWQMHRKTKGKGSYSPIDKKHR
jgi:hypothetical protein